MCPAYVAWLDALIDPTKTRSQLVALEEAFFAEQRAANAANVNQAYEQAMSDAKLAHDRARTQGVYTITRGA